MYFRNLFRSLLLLVLLAFFAPAHAQQALIVQSIDIQYAGPETVSKEKIISNMRTRVGKAYSPQIVEEDIRSLYATGNLTNVRIFGEPQGDGVKVIVVVATKASVSAVTIQGNTRVKVSKLRDEISTKPGDPLSEAGMEADRQKILEYYRGKGFNDVDVAARTEARGAEGAAVVFDITEGTKTKIGRVDFEGNDNVKRKDILKVIKTKPKGIMNILSSTAGKLNNEQLEEDKQAIRELFQSRGYADVEVKDAIVDRGDKKIDVTFPIVEGRKYQVGKVVYSGAQVFTMDEITRGLKIKTGETYSPQAVRGDVKTLQDLYGAKGYVDLQVTASPQPLSNGTVDVAFRLEEGLQSYLDKVDVSGNTRTKDKVIRRELAVAPGDVFNSVRVEASRQRLNNLQYFSRVEMYPSDTMVPGRKNLNVVVEEKRTGSFNFGAGFSSIDNLLGFAELTQGNFDLMNWPRLTGGGQKFRMRLQYGTERKDFVIALTEPYFLDQKLSLGGEIFYRDASYTSNVYNEKRVGGAVNLRKPVNEFTAMRFEYSLQNIELYNFEDDASPEMLSQEGTKLKSQLSAGITHDTRDRVYLPRKGHRVDFLSYYAGGFLGGDENIYGFDLEASQYFALPGDGILTIEGEIAGVDTHGSGDVPIYDRLYLGGSNDLRGFRFRDVGPKDENGEPLGGQTLARFTIEYTFPIVENIRGALFYDVGFVNAASWDFATGNFNSDFGLGVLLEIPAIGPIRIDYGIPLAADEDNDSSGKFNFNVGYKF